MTYTYKLAKRLALSHRVPLALAVLLAACSSGREPFNPSNPPVVAVVLNPDSAQTSINHSIAITAYGRTSGGDSVAVPVVWSASGGNVDAQGHFSATSAGVYRVVGATSNGGAKPDTAVVTVTGTATVAGLEVQPDTVYATAGAQLTLTASMAMSDGSHSAAPAITWAASGGTITDAGLYTAPSTPGTYTIIATAASLGMADTVPTIVTAPSVGYPNQPAGFTALIDQPFGAKDLAITGGLFKALYSPNWSTSADIRIVSDASAPKSASSVLEYNWNVGDGQSPGRSGLVLNNAVRHLYVSLWFKHSAGWEFNSSSTNKIFYLGNNENPDYDGETFLNYRNDRKIWFCLQAAQGYVAPYNPTADAHRFLPPNVTSTIVTEGQWHRLELVMDANTAGQPDGRAQWWVDGVLNGDHKDIRYNSTLDAVFNAIVLDPIWGGGGTKSHPDYLRFDHLYVSGR